MSENTKKKALDTQIRISRETRDMLEELGSMHDNYDDVIRKLIAFYKKESGKAK